MRLPSILAHFRHSSDFRPASRLILAACLVFSACSKREQSTDLVTMPLRGEVVRIDTVKGIVTIAHEEIPNYMAAMVMPFKVKDRSLLTGIAVGDSVGATLAISRSESWLASLHLLRQGEPARLLSPDEVTAGTLFAPGQPLPDLALLNQDADTVRFSTYRGMAVALTFIYTRCPLPDYCIRMSEQFRKVQELLRQGSVPVEKWHLLSLSFDSRYDRPAVLKQYGGRYGADFSRWSFLTDPDTAGLTVRRLAEGFGLGYADDRGLITHNMRTAVLDREGRLVKVFNGNTWEAEDLVTEMKGRAR